MRHLQFGLRQSGLFAYASGPGRRNRKRQTSHAMRILLTHDDGMLAPGIKALYRAVKDLGEIAVVAPQTSQSGVGGAIFVFTLTAWTSRVPGGSPGRSSGSMAAARTRPLTPIRWGWPEGLE